MINTIIDLSHHNTFKSFEQLVNLGVNGVILKATQGKTYTDPTYKSRVKPARQAGLMCGAYHFGVGGDGVDQAKYFLDTVQPDSKTLLALDFEPNPSGSTMTLQQARDFVSHIYSNTSRWPGLYSGQLIKQLLGDKKDIVLGNCWFWLAQYGPVAKVPKNWSTWTMWQYTDGSIGPEPKLLGDMKFDRDKFNGDLKALRKLWGYEG